MIQEDKLQQFLMPNTLDMIVERYRTLPQRTDQYAFDFLLSNMVVLDTETTGVDKNQDEIIEIAAVKLNAVGEREIFQTLVKPRHRTISEDIEAITHISNEMVADAPHIDEVIDKFVSFVDGCPCIAHNASFDRAMLERVAPNNYLTDVWIDSLELSRMAFARLKSHKLGDLAEVFGCEAATHRALDDVLALADLWPFILTALQDYPQSLLEMFGSWHEKTEWSYRPIFAHLAGMRASEGAFNLNELRMKMLGEEDASSVRELSEHVGDDDPDKVYLHATHQEIAEALSADGIAGAMYQAYEPRDAQVEMAQEVNNAFMQERHAMIEAGTGVGKSLAYLIPSMWTAHRSHAAIGVATKTNALTDQLMTYELPALKRACKQLYDIDLKYRSIKGYDHYPCLFKMQALRRNAGQDVDEEFLNILAKLYTFVASTGAGDIDEVHHYGGRSLRNLVTVKSHECTRRLCRYYSTCFVHHERKQAHKSHIILTNHALMLRDADMENALLPFVKHWVVDEAHSFEDEARRQWALSCSQSDMDMCLTMLGNEKIGSVASMMSDTSSVYMRGKQRVIYDRASSVSIDAANLFDELIQLEDEELFEEVSRERKARAPKGVYPMPERVNHNFFTRRYWIDQVLRETDEFIKVSDNAHALIESMQSLIEACVQFREIAREEEDLTSCPIDMQINQLRQMLRALVLLFDENAKQASAYVFSFSVTGKSQAQATCSIVAELYDVGASLAQHFLENKKSVVFTSGTLMVDGSFDRAMQGTGLAYLGKDRFETTQITSPYHFDEQMKIFVVSDGPDPQSRDYDGYIEALGNLLEQVHTTVGGSTLTLFSKNADLERIYQYLKPMLEHAHIPLIAQRKRTNFKTLRDKFIADIPTSLLGSKSFWEGFDASGETLKCVVIPKLPFPVPTDPLGRARNERDARAWWRYSLPDTVLTVRQAAGRLIRTTSDCGVLIIADPRLSTKGYGKTFCNSLPVSPTILSTDDLHDQLSAWLELNYPHAID